MTTLNPDDSAALLASLESQCSPGEYDRRVAAAKKRLGIVGPREHAFLAEQLAEAVGLLKDFRDWTRGRRMLDLSADGWAKLDALVSRLDAGTPSQD